MDLSQLSDRELTDALHSLTGNERAVTVKVLFHLIELETRGLFRELGFSSLFDYCVRELKYSQAGAYRRIAAARCLRENPEVEGLLLEGKVTLCSVTAAAKSIERKSTRLEEIVGCSQREVQAKVARAEPVVKKPREAVKPVAVTVRDLPLLLFEAPAEERMQITFSLPREVYGQLEAAKSRLSHQMGRELSVEGVVTKLLSLYLKPKLRRVRVSSKRTRHVPKVLKQELCSRYQGQCCYTSPDAVRCTEKHYLHIDHIVPFACGGRTELSNLRLLCPAHNRLMAEQQFGAEFIRERIDYQR